MIEFISQLPAEYQEVEYIKSSGAQYIDTSVIPTVNTRVVLDIDVLSYPGDYLAIFGERHTTQTTNLFAFWIKSATTFRTDFGSSTGNTTITAASVIGHYVIDKNKNVTTVQGITATNPTSTIQTTYSIYLLSNNYGGTADDRRPTAKVYSCQIYDSDILVRDFVPCYRISDKVAGLYDLVNGAFYTNVGSGTFTVGANSNKHATVIITPGGVISFSAALRRRMMMAGGAFEFTYTGQFTDKIEGANRVIKLISSGILQVSADVDVDVYLLAGGGGAIIWLSSGSVYSYRNGGSGGSINTRLKLNARQSYEIAIGTGGTGHSVGYFGTNWQLSGGTGGTTQAFGLTCTGGTGAVKKGDTNDDKDWYSGSNGSPYNGATNGGRGPSESTKNGGDGYVTITFS